MKKIFVIAAALLLGIAAFAQESNKDASGKTQFGPYETNKFWDNWFIEVGGGVNIAADKVKSSMQTGLGLNLQAAVGKWIDPCYGFRIGYQGISTGNANVSGQGFGALKKNYVHADFLLNFSNLVAGYKETRAINVVPYISAGGNWAKVARSFEIGLGIEFPIRVSNVFNIVPQLQVLGTSGRVVGGTNGIALDNSAALLLRFNLGKNNWTRKATTIAGYAAAVAAAEAAANAAQAAKDKANAKANKLSKDNKFLSDENQQLRDELARAGKQNGVLLEDILNTPIIAYFEIGKSKLTSTELAHVDYAVKTLIANGKNIKFTLSGNADSKTGTKKRNQQLSQQRADYLYKLLTEKYGLDGSQFTVKANGGNDIFDSPELNRAVIIEKD